MGYLDLLPQWQSDISRLTMFFNSLHLPYLNWNNKNLMVFFINSLLIPLFDIEIARISVLESFIISRHYRHKIRI